LITPAFSNMNLEKIVPVLMTISNNSSSSSSLPEEQSRQTDRQTPPWRWAKLSWISSSEHGALLTKRSFEVELCRLIHRTVQDTNSESMDCTSQLEVHSTPGTIRKEFFRIDDVNPDFLDDREIQTVGGLNLVVTRAQLCRPRTCDAGVSRVALHNASLIFEILGPQSMEDLMEKMASPPIPLPPFLFALHLPPWPSVICLSSVKATRVPSSPNSQANRQTTPSRTSDGTARTPAGHMFDGTLVDLNAPRPAPPLVQVCGLWSDFEC
jgi:hypothetical protein